MRILKTRATESRHTRKEDNISGRVHDATEQALHLQCNLGHRRVQVAYKGAEKHHTLGAGLRGRREPQKGQEGQECMPMGRKTLWIMART